MRAAGMLLGPAALEWPISDARAFSAQTLPPAT